MSLLTDKERREQLIKLIADHESQAESLLGFHNGQKKIVEGLRAQLDELNDVRTLTVSRDSRCLYVHPADNDAKSSIAILDMENCVRFGVQPSDLAKHIIDRKTIEHRLSIQRLERKVIWLVRIIRQNFVDLKSPPSLVVSLFQALDHLDAAKFTGEKQPEKDLTPLKDAVIKAIQGYRDRSGETNWYDVSMALSNLEMAERQLAEAQATDTAVETPTTPEVSVPIVAKEETDNHIKEKLNELDLIKDFLKRACLCEVIIPNKDNLQYCAQENYDLLRSLMRKIAKLIGAPDKDLPSVSVASLFDEKNTKSISKISSFFLKHTRGVSPQPFPSELEKDLRDGLRAEIKEIDSILRGL